MATQKTRSFYSHPLSTVFVNSLEGKSFSQYLFSVETQYASKKLSQHLDISPRNSATRKKQVHVFLATKIFLRARRVQFGQRCLDLFTLNTKKTTIFDENVNQNVPLNTYNAVSTKILSHSNISD